MIYIIPNPASQTVNYICPDQATIDAGQAMGRVGIFSIGGRTEADVILEQNRSAWLSANENLFSVNKDINPDPLDTTWVVCDLNTESQNSDIDYNIFNVVNGYYTLVTGLDNAKALLEQTKTNATDYFVPMDELDSWPIQPKGRSEGLQNL
jgi:hypothetical protein